MRCSKCGKSMPVFSDFCPRCGGRSEGSGQKKSLLDKILAWGLIISPLAVLAVIILGVYFKQQNTFSQSTYNFLLGTSFSICLVVFALCLLIKIFKGLILRIKNIGSNPIGGLFSIIAVVGLVALGVWGGVAIWNRPRVFPENAGMLEGAYFYDHARPAPVDITYTDKKGKEITVQAFPGEVNVFVRTSTEPRSVKDIVKKYDARILSQIPKLGFYLIGTSAGKEAGLIHNLLVNQTSTVLSAAPNAVVRGSAVVDLSGTGKTDPGTVFPALLSTDPKAKVVIAQLDNFVPLSPDDKNKVNLNNYGRFGSADSHGAKVYDAMKPIIGNTPVMQVHVGGWPCERMPSELCSSADHTVNALAAVVAGAEINKQKIDVNLSYNVSPQTTDPDLFTTARLKNTNAWATNQWKSYEEQLYGVLNNSGWAKAGNVALNQSAGNGVKLVDKDGKVLKSVGMDVTNALSDLKQKFPAVSGAVNFSAALNNKTGHLEWYSNFGAGVTEVKLPPNSPAGTSFAAPISTAISFKAWQRSEYGPNIINDAVRNFAKKTADLYNFDAKTRDIFYKYVEYFEAVQEDKAAGEKRMQAVTKQLIQQQADLDIEAYQKSLDLNSPLVNTPDVDTSLPRPVSVPIINSIPEPPPVDINKVDVGAQTISDCERWGGLVDSRTGETYEIVNGKRVPCPR